jgi:FkbM family methyltransferase
MIVNFFKKIIPAKYMLHAVHIKKELTNTQWQQTYSGNGEDIILTNHIFQNKKNGLYIDIGSFHPKHLSNTYLLYKRGWQGISIDPNPATQSMFKKFRPRDKVVTAAVSTDFGQKNYYQYKFEGVNTIDEKAAAYHQSRHPDWLHCKTTVPTRPLRHILKECLVENTKIDVFDIDVEGHDLDVLKSNDWEKYRPRVILVEDHDFRTKLDKSSVYSYLTSIGYSFYCYNLVTLIMVDRYDEKNQINSK